MAGGAITAPFILVALLALLACGWLLRRGMSAPGSSSGSSSGALASLVSQLEMAMSAKHRQRWARAAELYTRAADAAAAAGAPPDSLVCCDLRLRACTSQLDQARAPGVGAEDAARLCAAAWDGCLAVSRILAARADAGTLLPGAIRQDELDYARAAVSAELRVEQPHRLNDAAYVARLVADAPLMGYECVHRAATMSIGRLLPGQMALPPLPRRGEGEAAARDILLRAIALVPRVQHAFSLILGAEARLAFVMEQLSDPGRRSQLRGDTLDASLYDALIGAWLRPEVAAALRAHGTHTSLGHVVSDVCEGAARRVRDTAAVGGLRACALPACGAREATVRQFKSCGGCLQAAYCSAEHAAAHWRSEHRNTCSRAKLKK